MEIFFMILGWLIRGLGVGVLVLLLLGAVLLVVLLLQAVGVVRGVPFSYNVRNLFVRWRVTLLTGLAFTMVVGLMVGMMALVRGMYKLTEGSGHPENVIVMADGALDELFSNLSYGDITEIDHTSPLIAKDAEGKPLTSHELYLVVNQQVENAQKGGRQRRFIQVRGMDNVPRALAVHQMRFKAGGWDDQNDTTPLPGEGVAALNAVLGEGLARELGHDQGRETLNVGDVFSLGPRKWAVKGILDSGGSTIDSEVWTGRAIAGDTFGKPSGRTTVVIRTASAADAKALAEDLTANYKKPAVQATVEPEYYSKLNAFNVVLLSGVLFVAAFMALGGVVGIMNTMYAAISQRTKDVGLLRILGYTRWQVLRSFFLESMLLALIGGLLGCAVGSLSNGHSMTSILAGGAGGGGKSVVIKLVADWPILGYGLAFALVMGCVGGLIPALSAMRLRALESLR
jgi:ABC-type antimicrobial peptide transport system permease subunit